MWYLAVQQRHYLGLCCRVRALTDGFTAESTHADLVRQITGVELCPGHEAARFIKRPIGRYMPY